MSDNMETDLLSICLMRNEKYVVVSSDEGPIFIFKWDWFGDCSDRLAGHSSSVDSLCKLDEDTYLTGCDDGKLRGCSIYPNKILSTIG
jgi:WD40 repeat protein